MYLNRILSRLGYPFGEVLARATAEFRKAIGASNLRPRVFLRVDDYPHWSVPTSQFWDFHEILVEHRVPYLLGATPFLASDPLDSHNHKRRTSDDSEWIRLADALDRGEVEVALHGVTHRRRSTCGFSEFHGLAKEEAQESIARGWQWLMERGLKPIAFVPPFNRFPRYLWKSLPADCGILCLGPESLLDFPLLWSPAGLDRRIAVFSLPPFYGRGERILTVLANRRWLDTEASILPITLHWTWERADGYRAVARLAHEIAGYASRWTPLAAALR